MSMHLRITNPVKTCSKSCILEEDPISPKLQKTLQNQPFLRQKTLRNESQFAKNLEKKEKEKKRSNQQFFEGENP